MKIDDSLLIISTVIIILIGITLLSFNKAYRISRMTAMVEAGATPMEARCSTSGSTEDDTICMAYFNMKN